jgi:hypothetical protein
MINDLICSIVVFNNDPVMVKKTLQCCLLSPLVSKVYLIDNSEDEKFLDLIDDNRIAYIANQRNIGYGAGHNIGMRMSINNSKYHLVLNPDVYFDAGTLEKIFEFAETHSDVGLIMPKVLYPDGSVQYLCKFLPTPFDFFGRRFLSGVPFMRSMVRKRNEVFELRFTGYSRIMDVPALSGCFMFLRTEMLSKVGLFDERYFMYCEDFDLSRRVYSQSRAVFYPEAVIYHGYAKSSAKDIKIFKCHVDSTVKYFNKWGWFFDRERNSINKSVRKKCGYE